MSYSGSRRAARVRWRIGQPLLPEHFYAQEQSLREEVALRWGAAPAPGYGFARLQWDPVQLKRGVIELKHITVFFETGDVLDTEANAELPEPFDLGALGRSRVRIFLHLQSSSKVVVPERGEPQEEGIERIVQTCRLDSQPARQGGLPAIELGQFELVDATNEWRLKPDSLPPMVSVGNDAFQAHQFDRIERVVGNLRQIIQHHKDRSVLSGDTRVAATLVRRGLHQLEAAWQHLRRGLVPPHPLQLFQMLQGVYFDLCVLADQAPVMCLYHHDDLGTSFQALWDALSRVSAVDERALPHVPFVKGGGFQECALPAHVKKATRAFWLVKKASVADVLNLKGVKLAAKSRLDEVYRSALRGVPFERVHNPPFSREFSSNVEFFALSGGAEWDRAVGEGNLAFYDSGELAKLESYLYYHTDTVSL